MVGREGQPSKEARQEILRSFGLDQPLPVQYGLWLWKMAHGNMGVSYRSGQQVAGLLPSRLPLTVELALPSVLTAALIGIPLGVLAAVSPSTGVKLLSQALGVLGLSVPHFWVAVVLIIVASFVFPWLPPLIFVKPWENPLENLEQMLLPVTALSLGLSAEVMRMTRSCML